MPKFFLWLFAYNYCFIDNYILTLSLNVVTFPFVISLFVSSPYPRFITYTKMKSYICLKPQFISRYLFTFLPILIHYLFPKNSTVLTLSKTHYCTLYRTFFSKSITGKTNRSYSPYTSLQKYFCFYVNSNHFMHTHTPYTCF